MNRRYTNILILIGVLALLYLTWYYLSAVIIYILMAAVLTLVTSPLMEFISRFHVGKMRLPRALSAVLVIAGFYSFIAGLFALFAPLIVEQINLLIVLDYEEVFNQLELQLVSLEAFTAKYQIGDGNPVQEAKTAILTFIRSGDIFQIFGTFFGFIGNVLQTVVAVFSVTFIWFFFLVDRDLIHKYTIMFIPERHETGFNNVSDTSQRLLTRYIFGLLTQMTIVMTIVSIGMTFCGMKYALLIGFFAGLANIVPYVGPVIGLLFALFIAITTNLGLPFSSELMPLIFKICFVFVTLQLIDNLFVQPSIYSSSVKAHPLEIFILILIAASLGGIGGMIVAIPVYTIIRVIAKEFIGEFKIVQTLTRRM